MIKNKSHYVLPPLTLLTIIIEFGVIILFSLYFTGHLMDWSSKTRLPGGEFSYLVNSGTIAAAIFQRTGAIPLWNPFMAYGEPLIENPFSFVLNPFMTWPLLLWGAAIGTKVAVILHVLLIGLGGWTVGRVMRLSAGGRVLVGLLLAGSGSLAGAINGGFYQMALSQVYVPWIIAGLIGALYMRRRWPIALLAVATTLLIFSGTFWYVLSTAMMVAILVLFGLFQLDAGKLSINGQALRRVLWAGALIVGLSAIRLLPQFIEAKYVDHPFEYLPSTRAFLDIMHLYFSPEAPNSELGTPFISYHYVVPFGFAVLVVGLRLLASMLGRRLPLGRWRIIIPGIIFVIIFSVWAQEGTVILRWLYDTIPFLREWRYVGRMSAAASLWIIIIIGAWFDDILCLLRLRITSPEGVRKQVPQIRQLASLDGVFMAAAALLTLVGIFSALDVLHNWQALTSVEPLGKEVEALPLSYLRSQYPGSFLQVLPSGFFSYFPFYDTLSRTTFGNPDYHARGLAPTIGPDQQLTPRPEFAVGIDQDFRNELHDWGYVAYDNGPIIQDQPGLWVNASALPYAFLLPPDKVPNDFSQLTQQDTLPVLSFVHDIDSIHVAVDQYPQGALLVLDEVCFPGWQVRVNGQPQKLESVGERLAVFLPPAGTAPTEIVFEYKPLLLYVSAVISGLAFIVFVIYALHGERYLPMSWLPIISQKAQAGLRRVMAVLTDPRLLGSPEDSDEPPNVSE